MSKRLLHVLQKTTFWCPSNLPLNCTCSSRTNFWSKTYICEWKSIEGSSWPVDFLYIHTAITKEVTVKNKKLYPVVWKWKIIEPERCFSGSVSIKPNICLAPHDCIIRNISCWQGLYLILTRLACQLNFRWQCHNRRGHRPKPTSTACTWRWRQCSVPQENMDENRHLGMAM